MSKKRQKKNKQINKEENSLQDVKGIIAFVFAGLLTFGLFSFVDGNDDVNALGLFGYLIAWIPLYLIGLSSYLLIGTLSWYGWLKLSKQSYTSRYVWAYLLLFYFSVSMFLTLISFHIPELSDPIGHKVYSAYHLPPEKYLQQEFRSYLGGVPCYYLYADLPRYHLHRTIGGLGTLFLNITVFIFAIFRLRQRSFREWIKTTIAHYQERWQSYQEAKAKRLAEAPVKEIFPEPVESISIAPPTDHALPSPIQDIEINASPEPIPAPKKSEQKKKLITDPREAALRAQAVHNGDFTCFELPSSDFLSSPKVLDQSSLKRTLQNQAQVLEEALKSFGIEAKVGQINCGPTIAAFEVHPSTGVKVQKIKALENDIALNLRAKSLRIIAPIPGKAAVGIEVPNPCPQEVSFKELLQKYQSGEKKFHVPVLLGKAVNGDPVLADLTKMPHVIIAGATGSGKSVCINTIIMSIVMNCKPDQVKLLMVDPKKVELTPYTKLPHMVAPVITEPNEACTALNWLVKEMEKRYEILKLLGYRNIASFNSRTPDKEKEDALEIEVPETMFYMVGIIDELADLMMVSANDIETPIARIAQMARAVGIHLILATQRPSREVITGIIKANFPTRISFKVSSRINSQIILDETGAESLLGNGDMLFLPPGSSILLRAQGAYIKDEDINKILKHVLDQAPPSYLIPSFNDMDDPGLSELNTPPAGPKDALYLQAKNLVISTGSASASFLQRKLNIGYPKAASIIDQLEENQIVGPSEGSKARKVLVKSE